MHWRYFIFGPGKGLHKMLPMATPYKVHIDPASGCNFKCFFCPQSAPEKLKEAGVVAGVMKFDLFTRLVDGFSEFESKIDQLVFGNYGEPTLNKNLPEMVAYAVKSKTIREVSVISNAELLVPELSKRLVDAGLQKIRISIEALSDEKYLENTDVRVSFDKIVNNIKYLYHWSKLANNQTFVYVKILDIGLSSAEKQLFFDIFSPISHGISIENLMPVTEKAIQFIGEKPKGMTGTELAIGRFVCPAPFYTLSVHVNGDVGVCCSDWYHQATVGSIKNESIKSIWNGKQFNEFRRRQLKESWKKIDACVGCTSAEHYPVQEDLDLHRAELLSRYSA